MKLLNFIAAATATLTVVHAAAQTAKFPEPDKTLRIVVPFAAGGGVDSAARLVGEQLRKQLGISVIVDNRAGASGVIGGGYVQKASPDGYTLLFSAATHVLAKQVLSNAPYDPQTDFVPVARVGEAPLMLVIAPQLPEQKLSEVLASAKTEPGKWTAAIPAMGAPSHLATLLLAKRGDIKFTFVPYKGTQPALIDVAGGSVKMLLDSMISLMPLAKAGKVKPIAITSKKRSPLAPDVPTVEEGGLANFSYSSWYGIWAPKGTPADRVNAINAAVNTAVRELGKTIAFSKLGIEPVTETPEQFKQYIAAEVTEGADLLKNAGFKPQ